MKLWVVFDADGTFTGVFSSEHMANLNLPDGGAYSDVELDKRVWGETIKETV